MKNYHAVALLIGAGLLTVGAWGSQAAPQPGLIGLGVIVIFIVTLDLGVFR